MSLEPALLSGLITSVVTVLTVLAGALRRAGLLGTIERVLRAWTVVKVVREQHRMATQLPPGTELSHSLDGGPRLVVRPGVTRRLKEGAK
jgi:hypothetical protein